MQIGATLFFSDAFVMNSFFSRYSSKSVSVGIYGFVFFLSRSSNANKSFYVGCFLQKVKLVADLFAREVQTFFQQRFGFLLQVLFYCDFKAAFILFLHFHKFLRKIRAIHINYCRCGSKKNVKIRNILSCVSFSFSKLNCSFLANSRKKNSPGASKRIPVFRFNEF